MPARLRSAAQRLSGAPVLLVLVAIASVQLGSSLAKDLYSSAAPLTVAWLRLLGAAAVLGLLTRPRLRGHARRDWAWVVAYGLCLAGMNVTFYLAIERIPIGMAVTLEFLGPLGVSVAHSRRARDLVWVGLAAVGVALLGFSPGALDPVGVVLALVAGALWAGYILLAVPVGRAWSGVSGVGVAQGVGLVALTPLVLGLGLLPTAAPTLWLVGLAIGLLSSAIPYGLEMVALRRIEPRVFGILMSLEPAAAAAFALLVLGETLRPIEVVAMGCVVAASIGVVRSAARSPHAG
jgi:inner membrane transporter RhtA